MKKVYWFSENLLSEVQRRAIDEMVGKDAAIYSSSPQHGYPTALTDLLVRLNNEAVYVEDKTAVFVDPLPEHAAANAGSFLPWHLFGQHPRFGTVVYRVNNGRLHVVWKENKRVE